MKNTNNAQVFWSASRVMNASSANENWNFQLWAMYYIEQETAKTRDNELLDMNFKSLQFKFVSGQQCHSCA
jgi:hypothetical protein